MKLRPRSTDPRRRVGRYLLERPLGSGASATVYLARLEGEAGFARDVALKLVHAPLPFSEGEADDESDVGQPLVEARIASRIRHPNVVPVLDIGRDEDDRVYLVMEYIEGASLNALLRRSSEQAEPIRLDVALTVLEDLLSGLHAAHEARGDGGEPLGLVHRDVSPHNVIVGVDGVARLTDFGIAKVTDATMQTAAGIVKGKPGYMAPEQLRGTGIDRRTDVWAAGVIAWELLATRRLYRSKDLMSLSLEIVTTTPPSLVVERPGLPPALDRAVARALSRDSRDRWPTAEAFRLALASEGVAIARRDAVAAWVRGDPTEPVDLPSSTPQAGGGDATETRPLGTSLAASPAVRSAPPAPTGFEGSTEATASVSTMIASGARAGIPWRPLALAAVVVGAAMTLALAGGGGEVTPPTDAGAAATPALPRIATTEQVSPPSVVDAEPVPPGDAEPEPTTTSSARAAASGGKRPARAKPRAPARPPASPPAGPSPSGKLMDSPYR